MKQFRYRSYGSKAVKETTKMGIPVAKWTTDYQNIYFWGQLKRIFCFLLTGCHRLGSLKRKEAKPPSLKVKKKEKLTGDQY